MRIPPIMSRITFLGNKKEVKNQEEEKKPTFEELNKQAQERYEKELQKKYEEWQILIDKPQRYQKGEEEDGK